MKFKLQTYERFPARCVIISYFKLKQCGFMLPNTSDEGKCQWVFFTPRKLCQLSRKNDDRLKSQMHQEHQLCINYQSYTTINLVT